MNQLKQNIELEPHCQEDEIYYIPSTWATLGIISGPGMALAAVVAIVWAVVKVVEVL